MKRFILPIAAAIGSGCLAGVPGGIISTPTPQPAASGSPAPNATTTPPQGGCSPNSGIGLGGGCASPTPIPPTGIPYDHYPPAPQPAVPTPFPILTPPPGQTFVPSPPAGYYYVPGAPGYIPVNYCWNGSMYYCGPATPAPPPVYYPPLPQPTYYYPPTNPGTSDPPGWISKISQASWRIELSDTRDSTGYPDSNPSQNTPVPRSSYNSITEFRLRSNSLGWNPGSLCGDGRLVRGPSQIIGGQFVTWGVTCNATVPVGEGFNFHYWNGNTNIGVWGNDAEISRFNNIGLNGNFIAQALLSALGLNGDAKTGPYRKFVL